MSLYEQYYKDYSPTIKEMWPVDLMAEELSEETRLELLSKRKKLKKRLKTEDLSRDEKIEILNKIALLEEQTCIPYRIDEKTIVLIPFTFSRKRVEEKISVIISKLQMD